ncbi:hypothetical protein [Ligilactobacillus salivarius]|jgi:hypothetical protein|uniref:hypothetical protein n=1 Tax=Ligilactobacillus salivarius TaxID=1624 RepID=UPI001369F050|nr:hypothetical protein [Ligilactobacillus salivarius]MYV10645.1 hypothetical protein [Ligilactobacillus salivarius]
MNKVNTDNIPLALLTEIDDAIYSNSGIGLYYLDKTVEDKYVNRIVEILEYLGYTVIISNLTYPRGTKSLGIEFGKPTKKYDECELDCAIDMTTADDAWARATSNQFVFGKLETIVSKTYEAYKKGEVLKERLNDVSPIMWGTELWWLEAYYDIHVHSIDDGNTVVFEVKEVEI